MSKLKELHIEDSMQHEISDDVFGTIFDSECQLGLVDSCTEEEFDTNLAQVESRWNALECSNRCMLSTENCCPQFHAWFVKNKADEMKCTMLRHTREKAGLQVGDVIPEFFF